MCLGPKREFLSCLVNDIVDKKHQIFTSIDNKKYRYMLLLVIVLTKNIILIFEKRKDIYVSDTGSFMLLSLVNRNLIKILKYKFLKSDLNLTSIFKKSCSILFD